MNEEIELQSYGRLARRSQFAGTVQRYKDLLVRRWWVLILTMLLAAGVEFAVHRFQTADYVSAGQMIVNVKLAIPQGSVFTEELSNFLGTQAALMQSEIVVNRAFARVAGNANVPSKRPLLKVSVSPRTTIFNLRASGPEPSLTQAFLQASMEEYCRLKREMRKQASDSTVAGLTDELATLEKELRSSEEQIAEFQGTNSMVWLEEQGNALASHLSGLNQRLEGFKSEYALLQSLTIDQNIQRQDSATEGGSETNTPDLQAATNGVVNNNTLGSDYLKAKQQLLLLKAEQQDLAQYLRSQHPKMIAMAEDISRRERLLEIYRQQNVEQLEGRKASVALQVQSLEKEIKDWDAKVVEVGRKAAQYQRLKANAQRLQTLYQQQLATVQTLDASREVGAESVSIMEAASPAVLDRRRSLNNLVFAGVACLVAGLAVLLLIERLDDRVNSLSEMQELFDEPVLAQIPRIKMSKGKPKLLHPRDERHGFLESYRSLRSAVLYASEASKQPKTLLFTSTIPNEGKSLTAANLAIVMANAGAKILLVDADLRKGVLHDRLGLQDSPGLCEVLSEGLPWQRLVQPTGIPGLSLLPRGRPSGQSGELLLRPATRELLKQAAESYDAVLLDSPPIMAADDATTLAPHCDGVLFVLRSEHTSARVAHTALELLYQRNAQVLGVVFNAVRPSNAEYHYYKYKQYYKSYPDQPHAIRPSPSVPAEVRDTVETSAR